MQIVGPSKKGAQDAVLTHFQTVDHEHLRISGFTDDGPVIQGSVPDLEAQLIAGDGPKEPFIGRDLSSAGTLTPEDLPAPADVVPIRPESPDLAKRAVEVRDREEEQEANTITVRNTGYGQYTVTGIDNDGNLCVAVVVGERTIRELFNLIALGGDP
jgi:hypothetical protein